MRSGIKFILFFLVFPVLAANADKKDSGLSYLKPIQWTFDVNNPVIKPAQLHGQFDAKRASCCSVVQIDDIYRMYYWAEDSNGYYYIAQTETQIKPPHQWVPKGIILERQPDKPHNSMGPCYAQVIPRKDKPWLMYICAWGSPRADGTLPYGTNLATSNDKGKSWQYQGDDYILPHTQWFNIKGTGSICVLEDNGIYQAYYTSFAEYQDPPKDYACYHAKFHKKIPNTGIGYAESKDGINWYYPLDRFAVAPRGAVSKDYYEYLLSKPWVIKDGDGYRMWCGSMGSIYRIRSLTSPDGINWTFQDEWVFDDFRDTVQDGISPKYSFDDLQRQYPMVIKQGDQYHFWYTGNYFGQGSGMGFATGKILEE